jgi:hypothetical protein
VDTPVEPARRRAKRRAAAGRSADDAGPSRGADGGRSSPRETNCNQAADPTLSRKNGKRVAIRATLMHVGAACPRTSRAAPDECFDREGRFFFARSQGKVALVPDRGMSLIAKGG